MPHRKLRPGPGIPPEEVRASQLTRIHAAMVRLVAEHGYRGVTVRRLARSSGVSTRSFYAHFANVEDALASTCESLIRGTLEQVSACLLPGRGSRQPLHAGLRCLMRLVVERPRESHLVLVDSYAAGPAVRDRVDRANGEFALLLAPALAMEARRGRPSPRVSTAIAAGVEHVARSGLLSRDTADPIAAADQLADWIVSLRPPATPAGAPDPALERRATPRRRRGSALRAEIGNERSRILAAAAKLGAGEGYRALSVPKIRAEAGVSRRSFDSYFGGVDECFLAAVEALTTAVVTATRDSPHDLCTEVAGNPSLARLALIEILGPGLEGLRSRERLVAALGACLRRAASPPGPAELAAEASIAAAWRLMQTEVAAGRGEVLPRLTPMLACLLARAPERPGANNR